MEGFTPAEEAEAARLAAMTPEQRERARYIDGLRVLASVLESNEGIPLPYHGSGTDITMHFLFGSDPREAMAAAAKALPCNWTKEVRDGGEYGEYFDLLGAVGGLKVRLTAYRDAICKRVVVGTEMQDVDEVITPAVTKKVKKPVDIVEWDCGSLFAPRLPESAPKELAAQNGAAA